MNEEKQKRIEFTDAEGSGEVEESDSIKDEKSTDSSSIEGYKSPAEAKQDVQPDSANGTYRGEEFVSKPERPKRDDSLRSEETIGEMLISARRKAGLTLEALSQETKIPKHTLQYLETDNFEALPAKVYVKGFLRTYAEALGLDVQHVLGKYELQTGQTHRTKGDHWEIEAEMVEEKVVSPLRFGRWVLLALAAIAAILLIVKLVGRSPERSTPKAPDRIEQEILQRSTQQVPRTIETPPGSASSQEIREEPMELKISATATDSCWIELEAVSIVDQQPESSVYIFNLQPGHSRTFQATEEFRFRKVGNAGGIVLELNGRKLPVLGKRGKVISDYRVTRDDLPKSERGE